MLASGGGNGVYPQLLANPDHPGIVRASLLALLAGREGIVGQAQGGDAHATAFKGPGYILDAPRLSQGIKGRAGHGDELKAIKAVAGGELDFPFVIVAHKAQFHGFPSADYVGTRNLQQTALFQAHFAGQTLRPTTRHHERQ